MAGGADRVDAMLLHLLAHGQKTSIFAMRLQVGDLRWGRWRRSAQQIFENPFTALYHRGTVRVRRHGKDTSLTQQSTAVRICHSDPAKLRSVNVSHTVMLGETLVYIGKLGIQKFRHR